MAALETVRDDFAVLTMPESERAALCEGLVTLDGRRAVVCGYRNRFATVHTLGSPSYGVEFSWPAVKRVCANGGLFES